MERYFPKGYITRDEFKVFAAKEVTKNFNLDNVFDFLDFVRDGSVTKEEFSFRMYQTSYDDETKEDPINLLMIKRVIKEINLNIFKKKIDLTEFFNE